MKPLRTTSRRARALLAAAALSVTTSAMAFSGAGTVTLKNGHGTLYIDPTFFNQFPALGAYLEGYGQAKLTGNFDKQNIKIKFPLSSGTLSPERYGSATLPYYELNHQGGLVMTNPGQGLSVVLYAPKVNSSDACFSSPSCMEMGATFIVNGEVYAYVAHFAQSNGLSPSFPLKNNRVDLDTILLQLTGDGATAMNTFFGLTPGGNHFRAGDAFGQMEIHGKGAKVICPPGKSYDKRYQQCL